jgi:H+/Cl- antiporter ClcA
MICVPWWLLVIIIAGSVFCGFLGYFVFQWWLLSAPGAKPRK